MKKLVLIAALGLVCGTGVMIGGCTAIAQVNASIDRATVAKTAYTAKAAYVAALTVAAEAVKLPRCEWAPAPCIPQAAVDQIRKADTVAGQATQAAEDAARNLNSDPTVLQLLVDNAGKAVALFKSAATIYAPATVN